MKLSNGIEVVDITGEELERHKTNFHGIVSGLVRIGEHEIVLPSHYKRWGQLYKDFKLKSSDVVILTYPKCGTTWMQEILWTMCHNPDLNHPEINTNLSFRSPFFEFDTLVSDIAAEKGHSPVTLEALFKIAPDANPDDGVFLKLSEHVPDRRVIKTHLPFSLMPENMLQTCKVVYVARNPKDAVVSYLHHCRLIKVHDYKGDDQKFIDFYCNGDLFYGAYDKHLVEAWQRRNESNLLILFYEDMKKDIINELKKLDSFIGTKLTADQLQNVANHTTFNSMKKREPKRLTESPKTPDEKEAEAGQGVKELYNEDKNNKSGFYRKGEAGSWKSDLDPKCAKQIDDWIAEKVTPHVGFKFTYGV